MPVHVWDVVGEGPEMDALKIQAQEIGGVRFPWPVTAKSDTTIIAAGLGSL